MKVRFLQVTMPDGSKWNVPVDTIARHHAIAHAYEFDGDTEKSLVHGTMPLFNGDPTQVHDWAANNMDWRDVSGVARKVVEPFIDYQDGWINGKWKVIDEEVPRH